MADPPHADGMLQLRPVTDLLVSLAGELERMRMLGLRLESAVCVMAAGEWTPALADELQQLDRLVQLLAGLRDFVEGLSADQPLAGLLEISKPLERVLLHDLKGRLAGEEREAAQHEVELFA